MAQGPAIPSFIFRGHLAPIHSLHFFESNLYLASGDGEGWIVVWSVPTKRPVAVWKGHEGGVMGLKHWTSDRLISHGRDHQLRAWQLRHCDFADLDIKLPADGALKDENRWPWLLLSLAANALNYCAFSMCAERAIQSDEEGSTSQTQLIANPNGLDAGGIDLFQLPSCRRVSRLPSDKDVQTGMVMALSILKPAENSKLLLVSGYESGHVLVHEGTCTESDEWKWRKLLCNQPHTQPVLATDADPRSSYFITSSADATIARFEVPLDRIIQAKPQRTVDTKHAGQQDIKIRDDGKIFATAGWDKRVRVYSAKTMKELAVLKWHQEGCYAVAFAETLERNTSCDHDLGLQQDNSSLTKSTLALLKSERDNKAQKTHWLAAGGKDGKISLWDIY